jgi:hypothetical protein
MHDLSWWSVTLNCVERERVCVCALALTHRQHPRAPATDPDDAPHPSSPHKTHTHEHPSCPGLRTRMLFCASLCEASCVQFWKSTENASSSCLPLVFHSPNGVGLQSKMAIIKEHGTIAHSIAPVKDPTGEYRNAEILASKEVGLPTQQALASSH